MKKTLQKTFDTVKKPLKSIIGRDRAEKWGLYARSKFQKRKRVSLESDLNRLRTIGKEAKEKGKDLRLHFGCGPRILKDWINIDVFYDPFWKQYYPDESDYPASIRGTRNDLFIIDISEGPLPLPDASVSTVFSEDFIEHISQRNTFLFLAETFRVLKPAGVHRISTPDLIGSMKRHSHLDKGWSGVHFREWDKHGHLNILTPSYLREIATLIGYSKIEFTTKNKSSAKNLPLEKRPGNDREIHEQIFCDLIK